MPDRDPAVELQNLHLELPQLDPESGNTRSRDLRNPGVIGIGDDFEQLFDPAAPNWRDDPELGKIRADRIDDGCLLANEEMARDEASDSSVARPSWSARTACWVS